MAKYNSDKLPMENFRNILNSILKAEGTLDEKIEYTDALAYELIEQNKIDIFNDNSIKDNMEVMYLYYDIRIEEAILRTEKKLQEKEFEDVKVREYLESGGEFKEMHGIKIGFKLNKNEFEAPVEVDLDCVSEEYLDKKSKHVYDRVKELYSKATFKKYIENE